MRLCSASCAVVAAWLASCLPAPGAGGATSDGSAPGQADASVGGGSGGRTFFPDTAPCAPVGFPDVQSVFLVRCAACHGGPPANGTTTSLVAWRDFHMDSPTFPGQPLYVDVGARLAVDGPRRMPPPRSSQPAASEVQRVLAWVHGGANERTCGRDAGTPVTVDAGAPTCASGRSWTGGSAGSPTMQPGMDCLGCHALNAGPEFGAAGTVMGASHDADGCFGAPGLVVALTGADGHEVAMATNLAGNFHTFQGVATPYAARVTDPATGAVRQMFTPQTNTSCNACHTVWAGRLVPP